MMGMTLTWNYQQCYVDISIPKYAQKVLTKFMVLKPTKYESHPHNYISPKYGQRTQYAETPPELPILSLTETKRIQEIAGTFLYLEQTVDAAILVALNDISSQQAKPTILTAKAITKLLNYISSNPNPTICYNASSMILHVHNDGSYLSAPNSRSRVARYFFLSRKESNYCDEPQVKINSVAHVIYKTL